MSGEQNNRKITTNGGAITLDGEVAIGLNGGILTLDTSKSDGTTGGDINVTGIINSGNSYDTYIYGTDKWKSLVENLVETYYNNNTVPAVHFIGINYLRDADNNIKKDTNGNYLFTTEKKWFDGSKHYIFHDLNNGDKSTTNLTYTDTNATLDTINPQWYLTTTSVKGYGYEGFIMDKNSTMSLDAYLIYLRRSAPKAWSDTYNTIDHTKLTSNQINKLKDDISKLIAHNWYVSEQLAASVEPLSYIHHLTFSGIIGI